MSITLTDASGEWVSTLEIPEQATRQAVRRILAGVRALMNQRGLTVKADGLDGQQSMLLGMPSASLIMEELQPWDVTG